jgi:tetratricopeptide (TPR) repeat protein
MKSRHLKFFATVILALTICVRPESLHAEIDTDSLSTIGDNNFELKNETDTNLNSADFDQSDLKNSRAYIHRAGTRMAFKDYKGALADLNKAIELDPKFAPAYNDRSIVEHKLGYEDDSLADCSRAIEIKPNFAGAYNNRGIVEMDSNPDYKSAITNFNMAIELAPLSPNAYINRAWVKRRLNDYEGALQDLNKAIEVAPGQASAYAFRGRLQNDMQQFRAALESFRKAAEINPSDEFYHICIWLVRVRLNDREEANNELVGHLKSLPKAYLTRWPVPAERFLTDTLVEGDVLLSAKIPVTSLRTQKEHFCDANYYIGMKHFLSGDKTGAAIYFRTALDTKLIGYSNYESTVIELNFLK